MIQDIDANSGHTKSKKPSKRSWLRRKSRLAHLTSQVSTLTVALNAALSILQGVQNALSADQTALKIDLVLSKVEALVITSSEGSSAASPPVQTLDVLDPSSVTDGSLAAEDAVSQSAGASLSRRSSWASFHSAISTSSDSSGTLVSFSGSLSADTECESFCPCRCHLSTHSKMPWWITHLFGRMTIHGNGSMLLNRQTCNKKHCRKSGSAQLQISYIAPAWTLLQAFSVYVRAEVIGGIVPSFNIFMPRVIANSSVVWSIIEMGKLAELRKLLSLREASPYDISVRGVSLLKVSRVLVVCLSMADGLDSMLRSKVKMKYILVCLQKRLTRSFETKTECESCSDHSQSETDKNRGWHYSQELIVL